MLAGAVRQFWSCLVDRLVNLAKGLTVGDEGLLNRTVKNFFYGLANIGFVWMSVSNLTYPRVSCNCIATVCRKFPQESPR